MATLRVIRFARIALAPLLMSHGGTIAGTAQIGYFGGRGALAKMPLLNIDDLERRLLEHINQEESPTLGPTLERLSGRLSPAEEAEARKIACGGIDRAEGCLRKWPALFAFLLTRAVALNYSPENGYSVHPSLAEFLGVEQLSHPQRERLWSAYRSACHRVGLEVNSAEQGPQRIVGEFLHQVGLPLAFVDKVVEVMLRVSKEIGLPDEDDTYAVTRWRERLLERAEPAHLPPNALRALKSDATAYYPRIFCRACLGGATQAGGELLARMETAVAQVGSQAGHRGRRDPELVFREGGLALAIPPGDGAAWTVRVHGEENKPHEFACRGMASEFLVPLPEACGIVHQVEIRQEGGETVTIPVWQDTADNRLLIFDSSGARRRAAQLGGATVEIQPGEYQFLLRFEPSNCAAEPVGRDPELFFLSHCLAPGESLPLIRGPASLEITASASPAILWNGEPVLSAERRLIYKARALGVTVSGLAEAGFRGGKTEAGIEYVVRFREAHGPIATVPTIEGVEAPLPGSESLSPGLHRIVAELSVRDALRPLARSAALVWVGLDHRDAAGRLCCQAWPANLAPETGRTAMLDERERRIGPLGDSQRKFEVVFNVANQLVTTGWEVPGIFAEIFDYGADVIEHSPLALGSILTVDAASRAVLRVSSTEPARLRLPDGRRVRAGLSRPLRLAVANLLELTNEGRTDVVIEEPRPERTLVRLRSMRAATALRCEAAAGRLLLDMHLAAACAQLRLSARNLIDDEELACTVNCDDPADLSETAALRLQSETPQTGWTRLTWLGAGWPQGLWLGCPELKMAGRWAGLTAMGGDPVVLGFKHLLDAARTESADTFARIHVALQAVCARECQPEWLAELWRRHLREADLADRGTARRLAQLCGVGPPSAAPRTWLPPHRIEAHRPEIMALPAERYQGLDASHGIIPWALGSLGESTPSGGALYSVALLWLSRPGPVSIDKYREMLKETPPEPLLGRRWPCESHQTLGPTHYWHARRALWERFTETKARNDMRRSRAYTICKRLSFSSRPVGLALPDRPDLGFAPTEDERDVLRCFEDAIAGFARACRRESRKTGSLDAFFQNCRKAAGAMADPGEPEDLRIYLLQIGAEILAYYLILWESAEAAAQKTRGAHA